MRSKKKIIIVLAVLVIVILGFFIFRPELTGGSGDKNIIVSIVDTSSGKTFLDRKNFKTNSSTLEEFLTQNTENFQIVFTNLESGKFLISMMGLETTDMSAGPWWLYSYKSSAQNLNFKVGEAPSMQDIKLNDGDEFVFDFTNSFN